jgi:CDP-glucose 4,6-dehydratase
LARLAASSWPRVAFSTNGNGEGPRETAALMLNSTTARLELGWTPVWDIGTTLSRTMSWYRAFYEGQGLKTSEDLDQFIRDAGARHAPWTVQ